MNIKFEELSMSIREVIGKLKEIETRRKSVIDATKARFEVLNKWRTLGD